MILGRWVITVHEGTRREPGVSVVPLEPPPFVVLAAAALDSTFAHGSEPGSQSWF